ncbi:hypothetical protein POV27_20230 [Aureisphaera galaxeae]|uniref:hypothetical protein n=1 Tax=Aureisphaera galaxeae TaxID=1538023 RepID=UPI002350C58B|nr:hypothetical protein [Aureisphaera galaxeae]MDC8006392.1 hypothetical protein [Aureisphaera galaxeae]
MKKIFLLVFFLGGWLYGQDLTMDLDYEVTYEVPQPRKGTSDTLTVYMTKDGRYLLTEENILGDQMGRDVFKDPSIDFSQSSSLLMLDTQEMMIYMNLKVAKNNLFFKMDLMNFIPVDTSNPMNEELELITEKLDQGATINGVSYDTYSVYPNNEPDKPMLMTVDTKKPVNNNNIFAKFFEIMMNKTASTGQINYDIPEGLIVQLELGNNVLIRAIETKKISKKITLSHNFSIEE